ncbi:MAG: hypothetical protein HY606_15645 [Planctomycetes bacterium]|nr:hypothetical protein [Planctomycetota bacterium]
MWDGNVISKEVDQLYYIQDKTVTDITEHFKNQVFNSAENEEEILKRVSEKVQNRFNTDKITVKDGIKKIMSVGFDEKIIYATIELLFSVNLEGRITNMVYTERYLFGDLKWTLSANQLLEKVQ